LMSRFGLEKLDPTQLMALLSLKGKRSNEITKDELTKLINSLFNVEIGEDKALQLHDLVNSSEEMNLIDWIAATNNQDVVFNLIKKSKPVEPFIMQCPFCTGLHEVPDEVVSMAMEPGEEPVINDCPHCGGLYEMPELADAVA